MEAEKGGSMRIKNLMNITISVSEREKSSQKQLKIGSDNFLNCQSTDLDMVFYKLVRLLTIESNEKKLKITEGP